MAQLKGSFDRAIDRARSCIVVLNYSTGLAGLSAAYLLSQLGHRVRVLEKNHKLGGIEGPMRVPPNLSKILRSWVDPKELEKHSVLCVGTPWIDCK